MADLKYDLDEFASAKKAYDRIAGDMAKLKGDLQKAIDDLLANDWQGEGGKAFEEMYADGWADAVDKYVAVLGELSDILETVQNDYYAPLTERAESIQAP